MNNKEESNPENGYMPTATQTPTAALGLGPPYADGHLDAEGGRRHIDDAVSPLCLP
jgi:hypothetical protein